MESLGKYLEVERWPNKAGFKTPRWAVFSKSGGPSLGEIYFYSRWRQFNFYPNPDTTFNNACLLDIAAFLSKINGQMAVVNEAIAEVAARH